MAAMKELEFVPNVVARGLSSGKHMILGLVFMRATVDGSVLGVEEAPRSAPRISVTRSC